MAPGVMWTKEDCDKLNQLVERHGKKWTPIASFLGDGKTGKQCRRQWERLNIMTKQCGWTPEEDTLLMEYHTRYGNKWTRIARLIGGRTDNAVKNRYHALRLKRKTKYLTRADAAVHDGLHGKRCLRNCSSLEERRAAKERAGRLKSDEVRLNDVPEGVHFKSEEMHKPPSFFPNFDGGWSATHLPTTEAKWTPDACKMPSTSAVPYGVYAPAVESMVDGQQKTYLLQLTGEGPHQILAPSMVSAGSNKMMDDADSMESSSENKLVVSSTGQSDALASMLDGCAHLTSPFFLGSSSNPLPSRVVDTSHQIEMISYSAAPTTTVAEASAPKTRPDLSLDLTFQQKVDAFDFDSFLHSVSPMSPTAYLKFLNSLSPINRQPSCVSDHESHMKA